MGLSEIVKGSLIGAGASLLGGFLGRDSASRQADKSAELQREFAQHGIRWRVEDAKAAGVHPVYALSGVGASSGGIPIMEDPLARSIGEMGQNVGRAVAAQQTSVQRERDLLALQLLAAQIGESDARRQVLLSEAARRSNVASAPFPESVDPATGLVGSGAGGDSGASLIYQGAQESGFRYGQQNRFQFKPTEIVATNPHDVATVAGPPGAHWQAYTLDAGDGDRRPLHIDLPAGSSPSEAWESLGESAVLLGLVVKRNAQKYGQDWVVRFQQEFPELFDRLGRVQRFRRRYGFGEGDFSGDSNMP